MKFYLHRKPPVPPTRLVCLFKPPADFLGRNLATWLPHGSRTADFHSSCPSESTELIQKPPPLPDPSSGFLWCAISLPHGRGSRMYPSALPSDTVLSGHMRRKRPRQFRQMVLFLPIFAGSLSNVLSQVDERVFFKVLSAAPVGPFLFIPGTSLPLFDPAFRPAALGRALDLLNTRLRCQPFAPSFFLSWRST